MQLLKIFLVAINGYAFVHIGTTCAIAYAVIDCGAFLVSQKENLLKTINSSVTVTQSSVSNWNTPHNSWNARNVIDGKVGDANNCGCCSGTQKDNHAWLQVDLGKPYLITFITIIGQQNGSSPEQYSDLSIYAGIRSMTTQNEDLLAPHNPNNGTSIYSLALSPPRIIQYLYIQHQETERLTICEVEMEGYGPFDDIISEIRNTAKTFQTGIFLNMLNYSSDKAIDNVPSYDIDSCACCSVTNATPSLWQIDLRAKHLIGFVGVYGRSTSVLPKASQKNHYTDYK